MTSEQEIKQAEIIMKGMEHSYFFLDHITLLDLLHCQKCQNSHQGALGGQEAANP